MAVGQGSWNRRVRIASAIYLAAGIVDFSYHLVAALSIGDQRITWNDLTVAFEASLFWPVDLVVRLLSGG